MKKLLLILLCIPMIGFGQEGASYSKLDGYITIAEINLPATVDKGLVINTVYITSDNKYFIVDMGYKPKYFAVYELETQKYITLFKVPGWTYGLYYKDNTLYTSNGKKKNYKLQINSKYPKTEKLKHSLFNEINPEGCYYVDVESNSKSTGLECDFHLDYAFCWEYLGKVLTIKKSGCISGDCANGKGTYDWENGQKYVGEWKDDKQDGQGTYTWPSGQKYVGEWKDGMYHGQGTFTYTDGTVEKGLWENDVFLGN